MECVRQREGSLTCVLTYWYVLLLARNISDPGVYQGLQVSIFLGTYNQDTIYRGKKSLILNRSVTNHDKL